MNRPLRTSSGATVPQAGDRDAGHGIADKDESGLEQESEASESDATAEPFDPSKIMINTKHVVVAQLVSRKDHDEIDLAPAFQRLPNIWKKKDKSRLIESLLLRIPIPVFYVAADVEENWSVVDGVQRISTICDFVNDNFSLSQLEYRRDLEGNLHKDLPRSMQRRISETELIVNVIEPGTPSDVMFNIFRRINTGGAPLNGQEIRHALISGPVREYLRDLALEEQFLDATAGSIRKRRMADRECVLRFLAFHVNKWEDYSKTSLDSHLIKTMKQVNEMNQERLNEIRQSFCHAMDAAHRIFGSTAFRKPSLLQHRLSPINKSLLETWSVELARRSSKEISLLESRKIDVRDRFRRMVQEDGDFRKSISSSTGSSSQVKIRFSSIRKLIKELLK